MTGLEVLLAVAGFAMTVLVVAGMILVTPRGLSTSTEMRRNPQGSDLSRADPPDPARV